MGGIRLRLRIRTLGAVGGLHLFLFFATLRRVLVAYSSEDGTSTEFSSLNRKTRYRVDKMSEQNYSDSFFLDHHPEWGDEVLRKKDRSVQHPLEINEPFAWVLGVICVVGCALNFEIIVHILYDKNMLQKSKYIIQLAIAFSGLLIFFAIAIVRLFKISRDALIKEVTTGEET